MNGTSSGFGHYTRGQVLSMPVFSSRAQRYRERAEELLAKAEDFQDAGNRTTIMVLAEEYMAMADRLERFDAGMGRGPAVKL
jgi:hypothetical protein